MFKAIPAPVRKKILEEVKNGEPVTQAAAKYNISPKTIYGWLTKESCRNISLLQYHRLKKERDDLLTIIGELTLEISKSKKKKANYGANN